MYSLLNATYLQSVLNSSTEFALIATSPEGIIRLFNSGAEQMLGYAADELIGVQTPACFHLDSEVLLHGCELSQRLGREIKGFDVFVEMARQGGHETRSWTYVRKNGSQLTVNLTVTAIRRPDGELIGYLGVAMDISKLQALEGELLVSQSRFVNAFQSAAHGMALVAPDGRWLDANKALCDMLGYSRTEMLDMNFQRITHPDDLEQDLDLVRRLLAGDIPSYQLEKRYVDAHGKTLFILLSVSLVRNQQGEPLYFVSQIQDMTARKLAESAAQAREQHMQLIMDNVVDAIITIDERGCIETFNHAAERLFGQTEAGMLGRNISVLMPQPFRAEHDGYLARYNPAAPQRVIGQEGREVIGLRSDGSTFQMELQVSALQVDGQRKFVGVVRDITARRHMERMKTEFVSTVSHELRTPLTAITGSLELVASGVLGGMSADAHEVLDIAVRNSRRLTELINDLLDLDKLASGQLEFEMQLLDLMPLVRDALVLNQSYADQFDVRLDLIEACDCQVRIDIRRLHQVMANYLSNAAKFSPRGAAVEIFVRRMEDRVRIGVQDEGPGIPAAFRKRLFTKFSQGDASDTRLKSGTGLGLAITKELAEAMQGEVGCISAGERGTCFYIDLPLVMTADAHRTAKHACKITTGRRARLH